MEQTGRKLFCHDVPAWIDADTCEYFITICCQQRSVNQLCQPEVAAKLLDSVRFYHGQRNWLPTLFLLMPDHVHMVISLGREHRLEAVVSAWKRFTATQHGIGWQRGFFEHRLRQGENWEEKMEYIRQNPVRAGLVDEPGKWPYRLAIHD